MVTNTYMYSIRFVSKKFPFRFTYVGGSLRRVSA